MRGLLSTVATVCLFAFPISAQALVLGSHSGETKSETVAPYETFPQRPLTITEGHLNAHTGLSIGLTENFAGDVITTPLGVAFGLMPGLEMGVDLSLFWRPWEIQDFLGEARIYGRYLIIENMLAAEVGLHVPTAKTNHFGLDVIVPMRFKIDPIEIFAAGNLGYAGGSSRDGSEDFDIIQFGAAGTALYGFPFGLFVAADVGLSVTTTRIDYGGTAAWNTSTVLPLGVGAGYRITDTLFVKAMFSFLNLTPPDPTGPVDNRAFQIILVQAVNLTGAPSSSASHYEDDYDDEEEEEAEEEDLDLKEGSLEE